MQITNEFTLALPPDEAYALLLQVDQVAPCMPGAELGAITEDGSYDLKVTVKLGPMKFVYGGLVRIADRDDAARRAVLHGEARETRGQGTAAADITMTVTEHEAGSLVAAVADMKLTGRAAQSGRGIVEDVSKRMIAQMAACLSERFVAPAAAAEAAAPANGAGSPGAGPATVATATAPPPPAQSQPRAPEPVKAGTIVLAVVKGRLVALGAWFRRLFRRSG